MRPERALVACPNVALLMLMLAAAGLLKFTRLNRLKKSVRMVNLMPSRNRSIGKRLITARSNLLKSGPRRLLRPRVPWRPFNCPVHEAPVAETVPAHGFRNMSRVGPTWVRGFRFGFGARRVKVPIGAFGSAKSAR